MSEECVVIFYGHDGRPLVTWTVDPAAGARQQVGLVPGVAYAEIRFVKAFAKEQAPREQESTATSHNRTKEN
jgi:hypothetical protein